MIAQEGGRKLLATLKELLRTALPGVAARRQAWHRRNEFKAAYSQRQSKNARKLFGTGSPRVLSGPFAGLNYINEIVWGPIEPKWIGCYESELHPIFEAMTSNQYDVVIDIGSAEGYYSVSMAKMFPRATVFSYDTDPWARKQQARLAALNACNNLSIRHFCAPRQLENDIRSSKRSLVICDIEGFEYDLLKPDAVPSLARADILIEIHFSLDEPKLGVDEGCQEFIDRFAGTHTPRIVAVEKRDINLISSKILAASLTNVEIAEAIDEHRPSFQKWLWLKAEAAGAAT
jgi:hypothetical protein